jgi:competence protein ComEC
MNFLQRAPFVRLLVPLMLGIVTARYLELFNLTICLLLSVSLIALVLSLIISAKSDFSYRLRWVFGAGVAGLLFLAGNFVSIQKDKLSANHFEEKSLIYHVEIVSAPKRKPASISCEVRVIGCMADTTNRALGSKVLLFLASDSTIALPGKGDLLLVEAQLKSPEPPLNPLGFDYAAYLKQQGVLATAYVAAHRWKKYGNVERRSLRAFAEKTRSKLLNLYSQTNLEANEYAVLAALTLGYKDAIDPELREDFSHSGAMHILAVSGLHVGVIYLILNAVFGFIFRNRKLKVLNTTLIVLFLWMYAFITGLPPSVVRSATMFSLVAIGSAMERKSQIYNTIAVSAFIILLQNPSYLFDVGFQLSYSAVLSIIYFQPKIGGLLGFRSPVMRWWWDLTAVSLAAQIGTFPLALYYFHQFPNYFLLTNYVAIPLATLIIYLAVLYLLVSWVPFAAMVPAFLLKCLLTALNASVAFIHDLPVAVSVIHIGFWQFLLLFMMIVFVIGFLETKHFLSLAGLLFFTILYFASHTLIKFQTVNESSIAVYADHKNTHLNLINGRQHQLYSTDSVAAERSVSAYWKSKKFQAPVVVQQHASFVTTFGNKKIVVLLDDLLKRKVTNSPLETDILIVGNRTKIRASDILNNIYPKLCIVDLSVSAWYAKQLKDSCLARGIEFYDLREQGAYIYRFGRQ